MSIRDIMICIQFSLILSKLQTFLVREFSQLYRSPYFIARSNIPDSYHNKLKCLANKYLEIVCLPASIFDSAEPYKFISLRSCEKCEEKMRVYPVSQTELMAEYYEYIRYTYVYEF